MENTETVEIKSEEQTALETLAKINLEKEEKGKAILEKAFADISEIGCDIVPQCTAKGNSVQWHFNVQVRK